MTDMIPYFQNTGAAADGLHSRLSGVFWWAWNSNAGEAPALDRTACQLCVQHTCSCEKLGCPTMCKCLCLSSARLYPELF